MTRVRVKICGITNLMDAQVAVDAGADLLGFNLFPGSPRYVDPETLAQLLAELRRSHPAIDAGQPNTVGIFVDESVARICTILELTGLALAQLHGDEPPELLAQLGSRCYKALRPKSDAEAVADAIRYARCEREESAPGLLIDAYDPNEYGGTGKRANWQTAARLAATHSGLMLAGGLTPANVAEAVRVVQPWGVDVSSGVELAPGQKDHDAVRAFVAAAQRSFFVDAVGV